MGVSLLANLDYAQSGIQYVRFHHKSPRRFNSNQKAIYQHPVCQVDREYRCPYSSHY